MISDTPLIHSEIAEHYFSMKWSESHRESLPSSANLTEYRYLGGGLLYYGIVQAQRSQVAVVIGSGVGFVPKIIAQSQRDMKIKDAYTYWVDADINIVDSVSGMEFGQPQLDNIVFEKNLFLLRMRSSYASKLFLQEKMKIDYLHVDGDHSIKGILEDWEYYQPLLKKNAYVTFHDYSSVKQVKMALHCIKEKNNEINFIVFPNAGEGIALAQFMEKECRSTQNSDFISCQNVKYPLKFFREHGDKHTAFMEDVFCIPPHSEKKYSESQGNYLKSPEFINRYELAKRFLEGAETIVEINGFPTGSIYCLPNSVKNLVIVEPFGTNKWVKEMVVEGYKKSLPLHICPQIDDVYHFIPSKKYSIIWLGMEFFDNKNQEDVKKTLQVLCASQKTVLEIADSEHLLKIKEFIFAVLRPYGVQEKKIIMHNKKALYKERNMYFIEGFLSNMDSTEVDFAAKQWIALGHDT